MDLEGPSLFPPLSPFRSLAGLSHIYVAERGELRCTAIQLKNATVCLFSPVLGIGVESIASIARIGDVRFLLAPNHYHNNGLKQYQRTFPSARLCASEVARPRLEKVTGLSFDSLVELKLELVDGMTLVEPRGLKTGEVWLRVTDERTVAWLVVDAFCGARAARGRIAARPQVLGTFPNFGVSNKQDYLDWVMARIKAERPTLLVPCHGSLVKSTRLASQLERIVRTAFGAGKHQK